MDVSTCHANGNGSQILASPPPGEHFLDSKISQGHSPLGNLFVFGWALSNMSQYRVTVILVDFTKNQCCRFCGRKITDGGAKKGFLYIVAKKRGAWGSRVALSEWGGPGSRLPPKKVSSRGLWYTEPGRSPHLSTSWTPQNLKPLSKMAGATSPMQPNTQVCYLFAARTNHLPSPRRWPMDWPSHLGPSLPPPGGEERRGDSAGGREDGFDSGMGDR